MYGLGGIVEKWQRSFGLSGFGEFVNEGLLFTDIAFVCRKGEVEVEEV
jgi:hypothetical protein